MPIDLNFNNRRDLERWLERKNFESGSPEAFNAWLQEFFDDGNIISVQDDEYDYLACLELV